MSNIDWYNFGYQLNQKSTDLYSFDDDADKRKDFKKLIRSFTSESDTEKLKKVMDFLSDNDLISTEIEQRYVRSSAAGGMSIGSGTSSGSAAALFIACVTYDDGAVLVHAPRAHARYDDAVLAVERLLLDVEYQSGEWLDVAQVLYGLKQLGAPADGTGSPGVEFSSQNGTSFCGYAHIFRVDATGSGGELPRRKRRE